MIDYSKYSCDKCKRNGSWLCKHCWHTAGKKPTRFKPKKKTGCKTPEFRSKVPMPPIKPARENIGPKRVNQTICGTKERIDAFLDIYEDAIKIDGEIYWSDSKGAIAIFTTQEYKDYLLGKSDTISNTKENN